MKVQGQKNLAEQARNFMGMPPPDLVKNLFFVTTLISVFTCIIRSDFNFAFGLFGYYLIKTSDPKKIQRAA